MHYYPMSFIRVRRIRVAKCLRATPGTAECASHRVQSPEHATELIGCSSAIQIDIWSQVPRSRIIGMWPWGLMGRTIHSEERVHQDLAMQMLGFEIGGGRPNTERPFTLAPRGLLWSQQPQLPNHCGCVLSV